MMREGSVRKKNGMNPTYSCDITSPPLAGSISSKWVKKGLFFMLDVIRGNLLDHLKDRIITVRFHDDDRIGDTEGISYRKLLIRKMMKHSAKDTDIEFTRLLLDLIIQDIHNLKSDVGVIFCRDRIGCRIKASHLNEH